MNIYYKYLELFKAKYMLYVPLSIIVQSCWGSIAVLLILERYTPVFSYTQVSLCVFASMLYNAAVLAQLSYKWVFNTLIASIIINTILVMVNL